MSSEAIERAQLSPVIVATAKAIFATEAPDADWATESFFRSVCFSRAERLLAEVPFVAASAEGRAALIAACGLVEVHGAFMNDGTPPPRFWTASGTYSSRDSTRSEGTAAEVETPQ